MLDTLWRVLRPIYTFGYDKTSCIISVSLFHSRGIVILSEEIIIDISICFTYGDLETSMVTLWKVNLVNMRYEIEIRKRAEKDLALIPKSDAQHIADAIFAMENGLIGDIKKLSNYFPEYRLRVGNWRILFDLSKNKITIYRIINRKEAYR